MNWPCSILYEPALFQRHFFDIDEKFTDFYAVFFLQFLKRPYSSLFTENFHIMMDVLNK